MFVREVVYSIYLVDVVGLEFDVYVKGSNLVEEGICFFIFKYFEVVNSFRYFVEMEGNFIERNFVCIDFSYLKIFG